MKSLRCLCPLIILALPTVVFCQLVLPPLGIQVLPQGADAESPRMQKLKQLPFDRRPSAILKAWAPAPPEDKPKTAADPKKPAPKPDPFDAELATLQRHVTLGNWAQVKAYLAGLPEEEGKAGYQQLLRSLHGMGGMQEMQSGMMMHMHPMAMQYGERHRFHSDDLVGLAAAAPKGLDKETVAALGNIVRQAVAGGTVVEGVVARFKAETSKGKDAALTARQAAQLLDAAGNGAEAGTFLPSLEKAQADKDLEALNLLASHFVGLHARENKLAHLERAWAATQAALAAPAGTRPEQEVALRRAVELAPRLKTELGQDWLEKSFTDQPERGMSILGTIGTVSSQGLATQPHSPEQRLKSLQLQKTAVEALLKASPERARAWQETVSLLAAAWLKEAEFSHQFAPGSGASHMRRDRWGNIYFGMDDDPMMQMQMMQNREQPRPIAVVDMLKAAPEATWLKTARDDLRPKLAITLCQLHLKADEEQKAFPYIEQLAGTHPHKARDLANEFLRVWTRNHDPNAAKANTNPYMWMFGFEMRSAGIPLTRSKQERNLDDLAGWVAKLRKLAIGDPDEELLARAFTSCHSTAEVYRMEAIEKVFGPLGSLKPKTLAELAQQMRENLAGVWRKPEEQKDKKTNRKAKDIQAEVVRGYSVALGVVDGALVKFPDDWSLVLARAAILYDEVSFQQEVAKSSEFAPKRSQALAEFQRAARLYAAKVGDLAEEEQSTRVYEQWFYASLGACDLGQVTEEKLPDLRQPPLIRSAILALPGETAEKHLSRFANLLFTRMSAVKPAVKYGYLKGGFAIIGEHDQAAEAKKVFDYYKDLVTEIKLETVLDGPATVGNRQPFGVFVFLRHTREIERESGGFGRYLQNQNAGSYFSWNYGRPTADYRDKFQTAATEALKEHFEVLSVTFETDKVHSRATSEYGWRITPYAYLLLKARGPQVDKLPPLRIDLDFLDTSGYAVLPIESPTVLVDARPEQGEPRPARKLQVTQTLDERQAQQGKLLLEIKASALGLVPDLEDIVTLAPADFDIAKTEDQGVSVSKFDPESETIAVGSERTWLVILTAKPNQPQPPQQFQFAKSHSDDIAMTYQRYNDADLVAVEREVSLEERYGKSSTAWMWWSGAATLGVLVLASAVFRLSRRRSAREMKWKLPDAVTPFTVMGLLERIQDEGRLSESQRAELRNSIQSLERHYFAAHGNGAHNGSPDLKTIAEDWLRRLQPR